MRPSQPPITRDLVLVGGGHSHVAVLKRFGMRPEPGVRITLISRDVHAPYSGMLPGLIAGHYEYDEAHIDLEPLARFAGARLIHDEVVELQRAERRVRCLNHPPISYDVLSIDIGSRPRTRGAEGAEETVVPVKPIDGFARRFEELRGRVLSRDERIVIGVVGAGAGGVEILLAIQYRVRQELAAVGRRADHVEYRLFSRSAEILPGHNAGVRRRFRRVLRARGVGVITGASVVRVEPGAPRRVHLDDGTVEPVDELLWVTTAAAQAWPGEGGLQVSEGGFIEVDETLQSVTDPDIFAAGDVADVLLHPRPKAGVFAVRQGPPLADNLRRRLRGEPPRRFRPQRAFLSLISTGDRHAVASRSFLSVEGDWVWRWKDWIDRRFMRKYSDLPEMESERPEAGVVAGAEALRDLGTVAMRCAGCGSKVGSGVLGRALARLRPMASPAVLVGLDEPDDAAVLALDPGAAAIQTVDHFPAFIDDPYLFGRISAVHALGDIWAMGAAPKAALAIATLPYATEEKLEDDLVLLLSGAISALEDAGAVLAGGHTSEGAEMALGFAVTGSAKPDEILSKSGARPGQALVLTKALGTGTLFAARMRGRARGRWIAAALESMAASSATAAQILAAHGATAMTDVTGFGLLGHLVEMIEASGVAAEIELDALPALPGALELVAAGVFSSLQPQNVRLRRAIVNQEDGAGHPRYPLLFDPQTAGGLLATLPAAGTEAAVHELRAAGYPAARRLGQTRAGDPAVTLV